MRGPGRASLAIRNLCWPRFRRRRDGSLDLPWLAALVKDLCAENIAQIAVRRGAHERDLTDTWLRRLPCEVRVSEDPVNKEGMECIPVLEFAFKVP